MKHLNFLMVLFLLFTVACNPSDNNAQSFNQFTNQSFSVSEDNVPVDVEDVKFLFDVNENESVFDTIVTNGDFAV